MGSLVEAGVKADLEGADKAHFWRIWPRSRLSRDAPIFMIGLRFHDSRSRPALSKTALLWALSIV